MLTLPVPIPDEEKNYEAPQRSVKIKIKLNFYFSATFRNACGTLRVNYNFIIVIPEQK